MPRFDLLIDWVVYSFQKGKNTALASISTTLVFFLLVTTASTRSGRIGLGDLYLFFSHFNLLE